MKKIFYLLFSAFMLMFFSMYVSAGEIVIITGNEVRFRTLPNTSSNSRTITYFYKGTELTLLDKNVSAGNGCGKNWYKVSYGSDTGYVCGEFAKIEEIKEINPDDYKEYSDYLSELGFPDSYIGKLVELHVKHPHWQFKVLNVDVDFNKFVDIEYNPNGLSLIEDTGRYYDGYKSLDSWSYSYLTNVFNTNFTGGGEVWFAASKDTIAYYVDPRNFLNNERIFMFETLSYNNNYHTKEGIEKMLKGTFMESGYADEVNKKTFSDAFIDASVKYNVSPYVLVSRVIQEVGAKGSTIVSGNVAGYEGYYNFYNIKAAGNSKEETIANGLIYAKENGWDTKYKAIIGGASFLVKDYISTGQDTLYLQKWDIIGSVLGTHQYMQNIQAPYHESVKTYSGYNNMNLLDSSFVFTIPVYNNMPSETKLPNKGNPNNYLSSLAINGSYLFDEVTTKTEFDWNLDINTTSIDITASKVYSKSVVSGTGSVSLSGEKQTIPIIVTAENGDVRTYKINITKSGDKAIAIGEILRVLEIKNDGKYIYGIEVGTDISVIKKNIINKESKAEVSSYDKDGKSKTSGIIASGDKIKIKTSSEEKEYQIVLYGDVNSDGKIDKVDAAGILRHFYKYTNYDGIAKIVADVNHDNQIDKVDVAAVLRDLYGYSKIKQ